MFRAHAERVARGSSVRAQVCRGHLELSLKRTIVRGLLPRDDRLAQRAARFEHAERVGEHAELAARHLPPTVVSGGSGSPRQRLV